MKNIVFLFCVFLFSLPTVCLSVDYNIVDFGAITDSKTMNTESIQAAIDQCFADGGGMVHVPAGVFYTGTLILKSNVVLNLHPGAVIQGSYDPLDYPDHDILAAKKYGTITHDGKYVRFMKALVLAYNAENIGIVGQGTIKGAGEGEAFQLGLNKDGKPKNIFFIGCKDVVLRDFKILNSAQITISISDCERVTIDGIYMNSLVNWNADGIDVDGRDITISNCVLESEDDVLCFKSEYADKLTENITVNNCIIASICNGVKLGTGSRGGFRNISVNNVIIKRSTHNGFRHWEMTPDIVHKDSLASVNTGIVILGVDGGIVENISFSNITMTDVLSPFFIRVGKRFLNDNNQPSTMKNIRISNVTAETRSIMPSVIAGLEESVIEDVVISGVKITVPIGVDKEFFSTFPDPASEKVKNYPELRITFGTKIPSSAFYIKNVDGIVLDDIAVTYLKEDVRPAIYLEKVSHERISNVYLNKVMLELDKSKLKVIQ